MRLAPATMRVFIGFTEVAGFYAALARELRSSGAFVKYVGGNQHKFEYSFEEVDVFDAIFYISTRSHFFLLKILLLVLREFLAIYYGFKIGLCYDVYVVGYNRPCSIFGLDMLLARAFGVVVISFGHHGSESRPPLFSAANAKKNDFQILILTFRVYYFCQLCSFLASYCVTNPLYDHFYRRNAICLFYLAFGVPSSAVTSRTDTSSRESRFKYLHIPSAKNMKGTDILLSLFGSEISVLHNVNHTTALSLFAVSDLVIDQVYSDNPYTATVRENFCLGHKVCISGYDLHKLKPLAKACGYQMEHTCCPDSLFEFADRLLSQDSSFSETALSDARVARSIARVLGRDDVSDLSYQVGSLRSYLGVGFHCRDLAEKRRLCPLSNSLSFFLET